MISTLDHSASSTPSSRVVLPTRHDVSIGAAHSRGEISADDDYNLRELVADVAAAYLSNTHVVAADILNVISQIASSLQAVRACVGPAREAAEAPAEAQTKLTPAQIRKSITPEALLSSRTAAATRHCAAICR